MIRLTEINTKRAGFIINALYFLILALIFFLSLKYAVGLVLPFIIAFTVSALVHRLAVILTGRIKGLSYKCAAALTATVILAAAGTALFILGSALVRQFSEFCISLPGIIESMSSSLFDAVGGWLKAVPGKAGRTIREYFASLTSDTSLLLQNSLKLFSEPIMGCAEALGELAASLPFFLISLAVTVISVFFISTDYDGIKNMLISVIPQRFRPVISRLSLQFSRVLVRMAKTYLFLMLLTFTQLAVGFGLINLTEDSIGYPVPLALIISIIDILPVLGVGTVLIPWSVIELIIGNTSLAVKLLILYGVITIVRNFLEPKLVGERFGLHPAVTLLSIYIGGKLFGFIGVFALPLTLIILCNLRHERREMRKATP